MDQQQADVYIRLVGHLTQCTKDEAVSLLQEQRQLVDANLLLCLLQMERAKKMQGRSDIAESLRYLSCNLPMLMGREIVAIKENYVYFLLDLLQADNSIDCYSEVFHSILMKNLDKLNSQFVSIFKIWLSEVIDLNPLQADTLLSIIQNFSTCIQDFPHGNPKLNLEIAFAGYDILLKWHQDTSPKQWAKTQLNQGIAYAYLAALSIDAVPHLENAIKCFQLASEIFKQQGNDENWALSQNYLGSIHRSLAESSSIEDALQHLKKALKHCRTSRKIFKQIGNATKWALAQKNLGDIHLGLMPFKSDLISFKSGNKIRFAKKTIKIYISAINIYKRQGGADDLAMTMNCIGLIYTDLAHFCKKKSPQLNKAIKFFETASEIYSQVDKARWANVQNHLGNAYSDLAKLGGEDKSQNLEKSITSYRQALEIFKPNLFPSQCLQTGKNLGDLAFNEQLWEIAIAGYDLAITAIETSRVLCDDEIRREKIHGRGYKIYANVTQSCINLHQYDKALEYFERSRSKHLYDLITNQDSSISSHISVDMHQLLSQYRDLQSKIDNLNLLSINSARDLKIIDTRSHSFTPEIKAEIYSLEQLKQAIYQQIRQRDIVLANQLQVSSPDYAIIKNLIRHQPQTAVLCFFTSSEHTYIFIVRHSLLSNAEENVTCIPHICNQQGIENFQVWLEEHWLEPYICSKSKWKIGIPDVLLEISNRLEFNLLIDNHLKGIDELLIIPHLHLHLIPFSALPVETAPQTNETNGTKEYLGNRFRIRYIPSFQILEVCQQRPPISNQTYATVEDASNDLIWSRFEGQQLAKTFNIPPEKRIIGKTNITKAAYLELLNQTNTLISSHHASCNIDNPLESKLELGDSDLNLFELLTLRLPNLSDVFLSTCESDLGIAKNITDDVLTLSLGFLSAGAHNVVGTLWKVNDISIALFSLLYHQARSVGKNRSTSLKEAQNQLRQMTGSELSQTWKPKIDTFLDEQLQQAIEDEEQDRIDDIKRSQESTLPCYYNKSRPFEHEYYWAAFTCQGNP